MPNFYESCGLLGFFKSKAENAGVCEPGSTSLVDGSCVGKAEQSCGPGLDLKDGKCVVDIGKMDQLCGTGLSLRDGKCIMDPEKIGAQLCGPDQVFVDEKCIADPAFWVSSADARRHVEDWQKARQAFIDAHLPSCGHEFVYELGRGCVPDPKY